MRHLIVPGTLASHDKWWHVYLDLAAQCLHVMAPLCLVVVISRPRKNNNKNLINLHNWVYFILLCHNMCLWYLWQRNVVLITRKFIFQSLYIIVAFQRKYILQSVPERCCHFIGVEECANGRYKKCDRTTDKSWWKIKTMQVSSLVQQVAHNVSVVQTVMTHNISEKETKFDSLTSLSSTGSSVSREGSGHWRSPFLGD